MPCTDFHVSLFLLFPVMNMAAKVGELEDSIREVYQHSKDNRKEIGKLEGMSDFPLILICCSLTAAELMTDDDRDTWLKDLCLYLRGYIFNSFSNLNPPVNIFRRCHTA